MTEVERATPEAPARGRHPDPPAFESVLYRPGDPAPEPREVAEPACFGDLNLDQVVAALTAGRELYDLAPYCRLPLTDVDAIAYRHEVFRDLERPQIRGAVLGFADRMGRMRDRLQRMDRMRHPSQVQRWFLAAASEYRDAVLELRDALDQAVPASRGLVGLAGYLATYAGSPVFTELGTEVDQLEEGLGAVRYRLQLKDTRVAVTAYREEADYSAEVLATFEKFKQGEPGEHGFELPWAPYATSVEEQILDRIALLYPDLFARLARFSTARAGYLDTTIRRFDREIQLYLAVGEQRSRIQAAGLAFSYPQVSATSPDLQAESVFDLALAERLVAKEQPVVTNDLTLTDPERIVVVTGPNQGGKTTFARAIGQLHHLAALGFPVPARRARLFLRNPIYTHFEREEELENQRSKLEDDLVRIRAILEEAPPESLLVMNESLGSTTVQDAIGLGRRILDDVARRGLLCVFVTFLDELSALGPATVSMVGQIDSDDPARRTFRIERVPADGLAYAMAIARKHRLTYDGVTERIRE